MLTDVHNSLTDAICSKVVLDVPPRINVRKLETAWNTHPDYWHINPILIRQLHCIRPYLDSKTVSTAATSVVHLTRSSEFQTTSSSSFEFEFELARRFLILRGWKTSSCLIRCSFASHLHKLFLIWKKRSLDFLLIRSFKLRRVRVRANSMSNSNRVTVTREFFHLDLRDSNINHLGRVTWLDNFPRRVPVTRFELTRSLTRNSNSTILNPRSSQSQITRFQQIQSSASRAVEASINPVTSLPS